MNRLKNKVAIITGASGGMGIAMAKIFASEGAKVVLTDVVEKGIQDTALSLVESGREALSIRHDVSSEEDWLNVIQKTIKNFGRLDILINNAGMPATQPTKETSLETWERVQAVNSRSVFLGIKHAAGEMSKSGGGSIINLSSIYGIIGTGGSAAYHASKGAIRGLTKTAAIELAKDRIRVNTIHPGVIETAMTKEKLANREIRAQLHQFTPWPRFGKPEDVAFGALYLATDEAEFVTGSELVIDGGYTAQ